MNRRGELIRSIERYGNDLFDDTPEIYKYRSEFDQLINNIKRSLVTDKDEKIRKKIKKYFEEYPYLRISEYGYDNIDHIYDLDILKDIFHNVKRKAKLLDSISPDTSIKKLIKIVFEVRQGENPDDSDKDDDSDDSDDEDDIRYDPESFKNDIKTFKSYGITKLKDLMKNKVDLYGKLQSQAIDEIAVVLYPKFILNIDANEFLMEEVIEMKDSPYHNYQYEGVKDAKELQQLYNDIYHGFDIPEAPPAPFNYPTASSFDWESEIEEYRPRRKERIKKSERSERKSS
jgi:hypothetical protein